MCAALIGIFPVRNYAGGRLIEWRGPEYQEEYYCRSLLNSISALMIFVYCSGDRVVPNVSLRHSIESLSNMVMYVDCNYTGLIGLVLYIRD